MARKTKEKKTIIDAFVEGARNGYNISINSMVPNVLFAFVLIQILNLTGLSDILGKACQPIMGIFGLPGIAATVLIAGFLSVGGGVGAAASLYASGALANDHITILIPGILLMGASLQYMGRCLGTSTVKNKYYPFLIGINIVNSLLAMIVMRVLVSLF